MHFSLPNIIILIYVLDDWSNFSTYSKNCENLQADFYSIDEFFLFREKS
jgi:hypothetical protein